MSRLILHCCLQGLLLLALLSNVSESTVRVYYYSYYYTGYTGSTYYRASYIPIGSIVGIVFGALGFIGFIIGIIIWGCCIRRRRALLARQAGTVQVCTTANGAPVPTVSVDPYPAYPKHDGISYVSQPPPPYQVVMAPGIGYVAQPQQQQPPYPQQPQQPPYLQQQQQQPPPYPMQAPPVYPPPAATHEEPKF